MATHAAPVQRTAPSAATPAPARRHVGTADAHERQADRAADQVLAGRTVDALSPASPGLQRRASPTGPASLHASPGVQATLAAPGTALAAPLRQDMGQRFGHDFSRVRIHADGPAQRSASAIAAQAYTVGAHVVFGPGRYAPQTRAGRHLLAHELAHVVQQAGQPPVLQRKPDLSDFETGNFDLPTLTAYLGKVGPGRIEDQGDSDDKARAIVALWRQGQMPLTPEQKIALVQEMQSGFTGNDDERAILTLLLNSPEAELPRLFSPQGGLDPKDLDSDFQGGEEDVLRAFYDEHFIGGKKAALDGARGVKTARPAKADEPSVQAPAADKPAGPPRQDVVFIMGDPKKDNFYRAALLYFQAHRPRASFVTDKRSLAAVLDHVASTITDPIGNLYLVSHANEDGTLSFALNGSDKDSKLSVTELRGALRPGKGGAALAAVSRQIDDRTVIRIKGCDIGRTQEMLELLDQAFGGAGEVTAPTHEQEYGIDPELGRREDARFRAEVAARHPEPPPVDKQLKGKALQAAQAERRQALAARKKAIADELKDSDEDRQTRVDQAAAYEAFSGPMFQRPGEKRFTADELGPELKRLYGHLSDKQRAALAKRLVAPDPRSNAQALKDGTYKQKGQHVYRREFKRDYADPQDAKGFLARYRALGGKVPKGLAPGTLSTADAPAKDGRPQRQFSLSGSLPDGSTQSMAITVDAVPPDADFEQESRATLNNPGRYRWDMAAPTHKNGSTTLKLVATRVLAYLHHGELDAGLHQHFNRAEPDADFYARSAFAPPPPAKPSP